MSEDITICYLYNTDLATEEFNKIAPGLFDLILKDMGIDDEVEYIDCAKKFEGLGQFMEDRNDYFILIAPFNSTWLQRLVDYIDTNIGFDRILIIAPFATSTLNEFDANKVVRVNLTNKNLATIYMHLIETSDFDNVVIIENENDTNSRNLVTYMIDRFDEMVYDNNLKNKTCKVLNREFGDENIPDGKNVIVLCISESDFNNVIDKLCTTNKNIVMIIIGDKCSSCCLDDEEKLGILKKLNVHVSTSTMESIDPDVIAAISNISGTNQLYPHTFIIATVLSMACTLKKTVPVEKFKDQYFIGGIILDQETKGNSLSEHVFTEYESLGKPPLAPIGVSKAIVRDGKTKGIVMRQLD